MRDTRWEVNFLHFKNIRNLIKSDLQEIVCEAAFIL